MLSPAAPCSGTANRVAAAVVLKQAPGCLRQAAGCGLEPAGHSVPPRVMYVPPAAGFAAFFIWIFSPFVTRRKSFHTVVVLKRVRRVGWGWGWGGYCLVM